MLVNRRRISLILAVISMVALSSCNNAGNASASTTPSIQPTSSAKAVGNPKAKDNKLYFNNITPLDGNIFTDTEHRITPGETWEGITQMTNGDRKSVV